MLSSTSMLRLTFVQHVTYFIRLLSETLWHVSLSFGFTYTYKALEISIHLGQKAVSTYIDALPNLRSGTEITNWVEWTTGNACGNASRTEVIANRAGVSSHE